MNKKELVTILFDEVTGTIKRVKQNQAIQEQHMDQMRADNEAFRKRIKSDMERRR